MAEAPQTEQTRALKFSANHGPNIILRGQGHHTAQGVYNYAQGLFYMLRPLTQDTDLQINLSGYGVVKIHAVPDRMEAVAWVRNKRPLPKGCARLNVANKTMELSLRINPHTQSVVLHSLSHNDEKEMGNGRLIIFDIEYGNVIIKAQKTSSDTAFDARCHSRNVEVSNLADFILAHTTRFNPFGVCKLDRQSLKYGQSYRLKITGCGTGPRRGGYFRLWAASSDKPYQNKSSKFRIGSQITGEYLVPVQASEAKDFTLNVCRGEPSVSSSQENIQMFIGHPSGLEGSLWFELFKLSLMVWETTAPQPVESPDLLSTSHGNGAASGRNSSARETKSLSQNYGSVPHSGDTLVQSDASPPQAVSCRLMAKDHISGYHRDKSGVSVESKPCNIKTDHGAGATSGDIFKSENLSEQTFVKCPGTKGQIPSQGNLYISVSDLDRAFHTRDDGQEESTDPKLAKSSSMDQSCSWGATHLNAKNTKFVEEESKDPEEAISSGSGQGCSRSAARPSATTEQFVQLREERPTSINTAPEQEFSLVRPSSFGSLSERLDMSLTSLEESLSTFALSDSELVIEDNEIEDLKFCELYRDSDANISTASSARAESVPDANCIAQLSFEEASLKKPHGSNSSSVRPTTLPKPRQSRKSYRESCGKNQLSKPCHEVQESQNDTNALSEKGIMRSETMRRNLSKSLDRHSREQYYKKTKCLNIM